MRTNHVSSHQCGPIMCPCTNADQSCVLALMRTNHVSSHSRTNHVSGLPHGQSRSTATIWAIHVPPSPSPDNQNTGGPPSFLCNLRPCVTPPLMAPPTLGATSSHRAPSREPHPLTMATLQKECVLFKRASSHGAQCCPHAQKA